MYTLYGAEFSLYSGKVRAYLNYKQLPFKETLSTVSVYKKIIVPKTGVKFIPVLKTPKDEYLQDTSHIIDTLEYKHNHRSIIPKRPQQQLVALLLELYGDEWLLMPAMHYRWNHANFPFIYEEFGRIISPSLPAFVRAFLGKKIGARFKNVVPALGISDKTIPEIENWYENQFLRDLDQHFSKHPYLLGDRPCIGDFGFFGPLYAHLYRDPYPGKLMKKIAPNVALWVERMKTGAHVEGEFLDGDVIPETVFPILKHLFNQYWPILEQTSHCLHQWSISEVKTAVEQRNVEIPRRLGMHDFTMGAVKDKRMVLPYSLWMMQRPLDFYQKLSGDEQEKLVPMLRLAGGLEALKFEPKIKVCKQDNKFVTKLPAGLNIQPETVASI